MTQEVKLFLSIIITKHSQVVTYYKPVGLAGFRQGWSEAEPL